MKRPVMAVALLAALALAWHLGQPEVPAPPASAPPVAPLLLPPPATQSVPLPESLPVVPGEQAASRPYGFCPEPGENLPPVQRPTFMLTPETKQALDALRSRDVPSAIASFERAGDDPAVNLQLAILLSDTLRIREARDRLGRYLAQHSKDVQLARMHARLDTQVELQAAHAQLEEGGVALSYPPELNNPRDVLRSIDRALDEASRVTSTPRRGPLAVIVYRDRSELLAATCTPAWVGGVFDGTLRLLVGVGDEVIRHESLHAQLSPLVGPEPKWFHEGLAQWFADEGHFHWQPAYALMLHNRTYIPFSSLAGSFFVFTGAQDAGLAYAQSLAMIHWLVAERGEQAIAAAVRYFQQGGTPTGLFSHLQNGRTLDENALLEFLRAKAP